MTLKQIKAIELASIADSITRQVIALHVAPYPVLAAYCDLSERFMGVARSFLRKTEALYPMEGRRYDAKPDHRDQLRVPSRDAR